MREKETGQRQSSRSGFFECNQKQKSSIERKHDSPIQPPLITSRTSLLRQTRIKQPPKLVIDRPGC
jgi:hypothetical protein